MLFTAASAILSVVALVSGSVIPREAQLEVRNDSCQDFCQGTNQTTDSRWVCGDIRLGPVHLPRHEQEPVGSLLIGYHRFGGLCPGAFLDQWYNTTAGSFNYPTVLGFSITTGGSPLEGNITLPIGALIDRFGSEFGTFLAPAGTPYSQRAIPPQSLSVANATAAPPFNYYQYNVTKPLVVLAGPIAPWFSQPGQGTQYEAYDRVTNLVASGFLSRVTSSK